MMPSGNTLAYWYYRVPDLIIIGLICLLLARLTIVLVARPAGEGRIVRALNGVTGLVLAGVGAITPRVVPFPLVIVLAVVWLLTARLALFIGFTARGIRLSLG